MTDQTRQEIADAVNTIAGLNCTPRYRQNIKAGQAMIRFERATRDSSGFGFVDVWQVVLALPQQLSAAETFVDDHLDELLVALEPVLIVTTAQQRELILEKAAGSVPVLVIEGNRPRA